MKKFVFAVAAFLVCTASATSVRADHYVRSRAAFNRATEQRQPPVVVRHHAYVVPVFAYGVPVYPVYRGYPTFYGVRQYIPVPAPVVPVVGVGGRGVSIFLGF